MKDIKDVINEQIEKHAEELDIVNKLDACFSNIKDNLKRIKILCTNILEGANNG